MLIVCPTCASEYRIEADRVGREGRSVRCAACRETWFVSPADVGAALAAERDAAGPPAEDAVSDAAWEEASAAVRSAAGADPIDNVPPPPRRAASRTKPGYKPLRKASGIAGLSPAVAAGLVVLAAVPLACLARVPVVRALPQAAGLYARIGLPVNLRGIEIRDVAALRNPAVGDRPAELVVEGDLVGVSKDTATVPPITVALRDAAGQVVKTYTIAPPRGTLGPGETARFSARFPDPPAPGRSLELSFAGAKTVVRRAEADAGH